MEIIIPVALVPGDIQGILVKTKWIVENTAHGQWINANAIPAGMAPFVIPIAMDLGVMVAPAFRALILVVTFTPPRTNVTGV